LVAGGVVIFVLLFALAAFQAVLVSSQQRLDELERQVAVEQDRYQDLRVDVARLEAPERIMNTALYQLGMVPSGQATYVVPSDAVAAEVEALGAEAEAEADAEATAGDVNDVANAEAVPAEPSAASWPEVKPYLEPSP
jgi:cell division protein FtsL